MSRFVITIEDGPDGAVLITSDPDLHGITREAGTAQIAPRSAATVYAVIAWCALSDAARMDVQENGGTCSSGTLQ